jgi:hypothetical protein
MKNKKREWVTPKLSKIKIHGTGIYGTDDGFTGPSSPV